MVPVDSFLQHSSFYRTSNVRHFAVDGLSCYPLHNFCSSIWSYNLSFWQQYRRPSSVSSEPSSTWRHDESSWCSVCWTVPAAVLLYYVTSGIWQLAQQQLITKRIMEKRSLRLRLRWLISQSRLTWWEKKRSHAFTKRFSSLVKQITFVYRICHRRLIVKLFILTGGRHGGWDFFVSEPNALNESPSLDSRRVCFTWEHFEAGIQLTDAEMNKIADTVVFI